MAALTEDEKRDLRRKIERNLWSMDEDTERFFYENPDVLKHVLGGTFRHFLEHTSFRPPYDKPLTRMEDGAGWKFLKDGQVWVSLVTRAIQVDYRLDSRPFITEADVTAFPDDVKEDLEHSSDRSRILRAGGLVTRRIKRASFSSSASIDVLQSVIRLLHWKPIDARTMLAWQKLYGSEVDTKRVMAASDIRLYRRPHESYHVVPCLDRFVSNPNELRYLRQEVSPNTSTPEFPTTWSFLVEVPEHSPA